MPKAPTFVKSKSNAMFLLQSVNPSNVTAQRDRKEGSTGPTFRARVQSFGGQRERERGGGFFDPLGGKTRSDVTEKRKEKEKERMRGGQEGEGEQNQAAAWVTDGKVAR